MTTKANVPALKISDTEEPKSSGYDAWKRKKIRAGLDQAKDRTSLTPADQVWRELGLED
jgi:hypothetical protein